MGELHNGILGTCAYALEEISRPDPKMTKSMLMGTTVRLGDIISYPDMAVEIMVKTSKCSALTLPKSWKKFALRPKTKGDQEQAPEELEDDMLMDVESGAVNRTFAQLKTRTEFFLHEQGEETAGDEGGEVQLTSQKDRLDKEDLIRGFSYGTTYVPCPDGQFPRLETKKGIEICGFFKREHVREHFFSLSVSLSLHVSSFEESCLWVKSNTSGAILQAIVSK